MLSGRPDAFSHEAFVYDDDPGLLRGAAEYLRSGADDGEAVLVVVPEQPLAVLHDALPGVRDRIEWVDSAGAGHNPARMIPFWRDTLAPHAEAGRPLRALAETTVVRGSAEAEEAVLNEALLNLAFDKQAGFRLRCPYDARTAPPLLIHSLARTHPVLLNGVPKSSPAFDPDAGAKLFGSTLPPAPEGRSRWPISMAELRALRQKVHELALRHGFGEERADDVVLATHEICKNSVRFGGGGTLASWSDGDTLICEVADRGRITEPLVGRLTPPPSAESGRGLWLANQLCDLVQIRSTDVGTVVRLHAVR